MENIDPILNSYLDERNSSLLYQTLSEVEKNPRLAEVYKRISATEATHAETWKAKAAEKGLQVPEYHPTWRIRTLIWLGRRFGPSMILPTIQGMEQKDTSGYANMAGAEKMKGQEQAHAKLIDIITGSVKGGIEGSTLAQIEGRHRSGGGNALRAAVLGANDGLVSNLSLVMGVAGATLEGKGVLIAGIAGLLAGAISMALGEWLSVTSSRELYKNQIATEAMEIEENPEEEIAELVLIYESRGIQPETAKNLAERDAFPTNQRAGYPLPGRTGRQPAGIGRVRMGGSHHFVSAVCARRHPTSGTVHLLKRLPCSFCQYRVQCGRALPARRCDHPFTGRTVLYSGFRMVIFGLIAAAVTFGIGTLIGGGVTGG